MVWGAGVLRPLANSVTLGTPALGVCVSWHWPSLLGPEEGEDQPGVGRL